MIGPLPLLFIFEKKIRRGGGYESSTSKTQYYPKKAIFFILARHECLSESLELIRKAQKGVVTDMIFYAALCAISLFLFMATFSGRIYSSFANVCRVRLGGNVIFSAPS